MNQEPTPPRRARRLAPEWWAVLLGALLAVGLALDWPWLRGNEEFSWQRYDVPGLAGRVGPVVAAVALLGLLGYWLMRAARPDASRRSATLTALALVVLGLGARIAFQYVEHPDPLVTLFYRTVSTRNLGAFYYDGINVTDMPAFLRDFPQRMPDLVGFSARTHPPGIPLLFWATGQLLEQLPPLATVLGGHFRDYVCAVRDSPILFLPDPLLAASALQVAMPLWGALSVVPFFFLARRLVGHDAATRGGVFLALTPAMVLFIAHWAHAYTLLGIIALLLLHLGLEKQRAVYLFLAGVVLSFSTFLSFSNLALAAVLGGYWVLYAAWRGDGTDYLKKWVVPLRQALVFLAGVLSIWLGYRLLFGVSFLEVYRQGMAAHETITGYRSYGLWLVYNLIDFWLFLGIPALIATVAMARRVWRPVDEFADGRRYAPFWTFILVLLGLNLSGITRGEVARLWMFLAPLAWLAVLPVLARWPRRRLAVMLGVQLVQLLLLGVFVRTVGPTNYPYYFPQAMATQLPAEATRTAVAFGPQPGIRLVGFELDRAAASDAIDVTLYWQSDSRPAYPYTVFVHLLASDGALVAQHDSMPANDAWPAICWRPGEVVADTHQLSLPAGLPAGSALYVGLYRLDLMNQGDPNPRLAATWPGGQGDAYPLDAAPLLQP